MPQILVLYTAGSGVAGSFRTLIGQSVTEVETRTLLGEHAWSKTTHTPIDRDTLHTKVIATLADALSSGQVLTRGALADTITFPDGRYVARDDSGGRIKIYLGRVA